MDTKEDRFSKMSFVAGAMLAALSAFGCDQGNTEDVETRTSNLYFLGTTWPSGNVQVCYDATDGNQPRLLGRARTLLADTWSQASNISFTGWGACNYLPTTTSRSFVALHFITGGRGNTSSLGPVPATGVAPSRCGAIGPCFTPGVNNVYLIFDDASNPNFEQKISADDLFRNVVIHEFGHVLGYAHEQERPDNWNGDTAIFCPNVQDGIKARPGGTYETSFFDAPQSSDPSAPNPGSIMSYCSSNPLDITLHPSNLSRGDVLGVRKSYGRNSVAHGFMIKSDTNSVLAVNAFGGAADGVILKLSNACTITNADCTWTYQYGMLVSDTDPTLAINAYGGAADGVTLKLSKNCTPANPDCTWTYKKGEFLSDTNPALAINAYGGAQNQTILKLAQACTASNPDCTWTMPNIMLANSRDIALRVNAFGGATNNGPLRLSDVCTQQNTDCTFTLNKGMLKSDTNSTLAMNAYGGAREGTVVQLSNACTSSNPDCTWTWKRGEVISDNTSQGTFPISTIGKALNGAGFTLAAACTSNNVDCVYNGFFARN